MKSSSNFPPNPKVLRIIALAVLVAIAAVVAFLNWREKADAPRLTGTAHEMRESTSDWTKVEKDGSELLRDLREDKVATAGIGSSAVLVATTGGEKYFVVDGRGAFAAAVVADAKDPEKKHFQLVVLPDAQIGAPAADSSGLSTARELMGVLLPVLLIGGLVFLMRDELLGGAKLVEQPTTTFDDVIGAGEAKNALKDVVAYLKDPSRFDEIGGRPPAGLLLLGGPGVGKTLLAKAVAGEAKVSIIAVSGSDFSSKYFGMGIQKVKKTFELARKNAPCILFIDEVDGVAMRTSTGGGPAESESNRIINQVLVEMDGFSANAGVIVIGATNLADNLDPALLREGRFDRRVNVPLPDVRDRAEVFQLYAKKVKVAGEVDFDQLARLTTGLSPAAIAYVVNHSTLVATRLGEKAVRMPHLVEAVETVRIGELNGGQRTLTAKERKYLAVHEGGHALVSSLLGHGKVEKVTILPRGGALGVTLVTQDEDKKLMLESDMEKQIMVLLGGRNAELEVFEEASSGASQDLKEASKLALDMVTRFGFGDDGALFSLAALPAEQAGQQLSAAIKQANVLLTDLNGQCQQLLMQHRGALDMLTQELLAHETVSGERVMELVGRGPLGSRTVPPPVLVTAG